MADINPTAIVEEGARLAANVRVGPFCTVGADVILGPGVALRSHVIVTGRTEIGAGTLIHAFAAIGGSPQDMSYKDEPTAVRIGERCTIHENATVHRGTARGKGVTTIGNDCFLMVGAHVAHDCVVGDHVVLTNCATLGGHVEVGEYAILGGLAAVQQRCRVGPHAFIGALTGVTTDVIPFGMAVGHRAELNGLNIVGMKRRGFDRPAIHASRAAYRAIFFGTGGSLSERVEQVAREYAEVPAVMSIVKFIRAGNGTALCIPRDDNGN